VTRYVDPAADALAAVTRLVLGAAAALILHTQISGAVTAIAVGASAHGVPPERRSPTGVWCGA
jgi:hypothetical protein